MQGEIGIDASGLLEPYHPKAVYFEESDIVEYVRSDTPCVYRRIDEVLTLVLDLYSREPIGFALKGFKNLYWQYLRPKYQVTEHEFVELTSVLEDVLGLVGNEVFGDRKAAYERAMEIASKDNVSLSEDELPKAA